MLEATPSAVSAIKQTLAQTDVPETHALRLTLGQQGLAIVPDEVRADDITIVQDDDDRPLMVTDQPVADRLDGRTIDFNATSSQLIVS